MGVGECVFVCVLSWCAELRFEAKHTHIMLAFSCKSFMDRRMINESRFVCGYTQYTIHTVRFNKTVDLIVTLKFKLVSTYVYRDMLLLVAFFSFIATVGLFNSEIDGYIPICDIMRKCGFNFNCNTLRDIKCEPI